MQTINKVLTTAIKQLSGISANSGLDATILLAHASGLTKLEIITQGEEQLAEETINKFFELLERRKKHEPIAYITGTKEFWGLDFEVEKGVLIPRPDTETLIATLLSLIPNPNIEGTVADLGTGTGAIIISILTEFKNMQGFATDINEKALNLSHLNAKKHNVENRLTILNGAWAEPLPQPVNIIISNPPYISEQDMQNLMPDVKNFEPELALSGGEDGLDCYKQLIPSAHKKLTDGGILMLETGLNQHPQIYKLLEDSKWKEVKSFKDLSGKDRVIVALKK